MRILLVINALRGGGAQRQLAEMARLFDKYGHDVTLATLVDTPDDYPVPNSVRRMKLGKRGNKLANWIEIFLFFQREKKDAIIVFLENRAVVYYTWFHFFRKYKIIAGERWMFDPAINKKARWNLKLFYNFVDYIVPNSYSQRDVFVQYKPKWKNKIITIHNYTDPNRYIAKPLPHNSVCQIGIFARYSEEKNPYNFIEAIKRLKKETNYPFKFLWYGYRYASDGEETPVSSKMKGMIKEYGLEREIELNDRTNDVIDVMSKLDCVCLPSFMEGYPNTIAEAICCGRPVLASNVADNATMVHDGVNGYLFNPCNIDEMVLAFKRFLNLDRADKDRLATNSRKLAEKLFDETNFVNEYIKLIQNGNK